MGSRVGVVALLLLVAGCATVQQPVPPELGAAPAWQVKGLDGFRFNQRVRFGEYEAHDVARGSTRSRSGIRDALVGRTRLQQRYSFRFRHAGEAADRFHVRCDNRAQEQSLQLNRTTALELDSSSALECTLEVADGGVWTLRLAAPQSGRARGVVALVDDRYVVEGDAQTSHGVVTGMAGYRIRCDERVVAAVDLSGRTVRLLPDVAAEERHLLAAVAAALLLQDRLTSD
jgi:hypothetical protein